MSDSSSTEQVIDGKYRIEKLLGKGGMGSVHLATHIGTGRPVALKLIAEQFMQRHEFVERFRREAQAAGRLRHPNVVDVTDFGFSISESGKKTAYLVMEYLDGCTLGEVLEEEKNVPLDFTIDVIEQVCSAVTEAHRQGIIHRDLKPDNIWLEPNQRGGYTVKVLDFGIAKLEETQFSIPESESGQFLVRDGSQARLSGSGFQTVPENPGSGTVVDDDSKGTLAGESATLAIPAEGATVIAEAGSEAGTMIQDSPEPDSDSAPSEAGTLVANNAGTTGEVDVADSKGTRLIEEATDRTPKEASNTANLTRAGAVLGTPLYMSPEQCRGEKLTPQSDIYSLAVIVYQMLAGRLPFNGDYVEVMDGHKNDDPPELNPKEAPKRLRVVVMRAMSKSSDERPETADTLASKMRANAEGVGGVFRSAIMVYGQYLQKFLLLSLIAFAPILVMTSIRVAIGLLTATGVIEVPGLKEAVAAISGISSFFIQIVCVALLFGMVTWIVGRTIAYPLRPVSLRSAFNEVKKRWRALAWTVSLSTLTMVLVASLGIMLAVLSFILLSIFIPAPPWTVFFFVKIVFAVVIALLVIALVSGPLMMVAPTVMMEGLSGIKAFKRSFQLFSRWRLPMSLIGLGNFILPVVLAIVVAASVGAIIQVYKLRVENERMKREGVVAQKTVEKKEEDEADGGTNVNISIGPKGARVSTADNSEKTKLSKEEIAQNKLTEAIREAIFELLWAPISLIMMSFSTVLTAMIYFKLRRAGGETMQSLLGKLEDEDQLQTNWERRVRDRLIQSGKISTTT